MNTIDKKIGKSYLTLFVNSDTLITITLGGDLMISDAKKRVQISLTLDTMDKLEAYAKIKGYNKSTIVKLALDEYFSERASKN